MSDFSLRAPHTMMGFIVHLDPSLTERVQHSRSPARARRRARLGHPQHFITRPRQAVFQLGDRLVMHPDTWIALAALEGVCGNG